MTALDATPDDTRGHAAPLPAWRVPGWWRDAVAALTSAALDKAHR